MLGIRQNYSAKLRAMFAVIALLVCSTSASISLASVSSDACAMACCIEEGHCCCSPPRASVKGQSHDGPSFNEADVTAPCPEGCTNPTTSSKTIARVALRAPSQPVVFSESTTIRSEQSISDQLSVDLDSSPPRGPPLNFTSV